MDDETAALAGAGMTDDFRLRGSRTWRRMHGKLTPAMIRFGIPDARK